MSERAIHRQDAVQPKREPQKRPRNHLLSTYYGLSSSPPSPPSSPSSPQADSVSLIQTLSLPRLLSSSEDLDYKAQNLTSALSASITATYDHLSSAHATSKDALSMSSTLLNRTISTAHQLEVTANQAAAVNERLQDVRDNLARVQRLRRVLNLIRASEVLARSLREDYNVLELCTDPDGMWRKLLVTARRYSVLTPILRSLRGMSSEFREALHTLVSLGKEVRTDIGRRLKGRDSDELPLRNCIILMSMLEGQTAELQEVFWSSARNIIDKKRLAKAALENDGDSPLAMAACCMSFALDVIMPLVISFVKDFRSLFHSKDASLQIKEWISGVLEEKVISPVKETLSGQPVFSCSSEGDAERFMTGLDRFLQFKELFPGEEALFKSSCHTLEKCLEHELKLDVDNVIWEKVKMMLSKDYTSRSDTTFGSGELHHMLEEDAKRFCNQINGIVEKLEKLASRIRCDFSTRDARRTLFKKLCSMSSGHVVAIKLLREMKAEQHFADEVLSNYKTKKVHQIGALLADEVRAIAENAKERHSIEEVSEQIRDACRLLEQVKLDVSMMSTSETVTSYMSHGLYSGSHLLDHRNFGLGAVFNGVVRSWIDFISDAQFQNEAAVHAIQIDACAVAETMGVNLDPVVQAAVEQCRTEVSLLDGEVLRERS